MEIVVEQVLILTNAFNCRLVGYVFVFPLQLAFCMLLSNSLSLFKYILAVPSD